jgi:CHAT domain-containing protein/Flp pilus assembly protein TadD
MLLLKEAVLITGILLSTSLGLFEISNSYVNNNQKAESQQSRDKNNGSPTSDEKLSSEFYRYLHLIQNKPVNKAKIQSELQSLPNEFERIYLSALLKKRGGDFESAFNLLYSLLNYSPEIFDYYEQISNLGKMSGNLDTLSGWLKQQVNNLNVLHYYLKGFVENEKGLTDSSISTYDKLISEGHSSKEVFYQQASALRKVGNYKDAFINLSKAEKMCGDDDYFLSKIINLKGTLFFLSGDYDKAKSEYRAALKLAKQSENTVEEIKSLANLAIIKDMYGKIEEARRDFSTGIKMAGEIENTELLAFLYSEYGVSFTYTNNLVEARHNYEQSYSRYQLLHNNERLSYLSANIGSLFLQISNYKSALKYYNEGLDYAGDNKLGKILNLTGIADVYSNESNYSKALEYYNKAKDVADSIKDVPSIIKIDEGIGALYYNINRPLLALESLKKADETATMHQMPLEHIKWYSNIGTVLTSIDSVDQAEKYFGRGLNLAGQTGDVYNSILLKTELAYNYYVQRKYSDAKNILSEAQKSAKAYNLTQVLGQQDLYWGKIYSELKNYNQAISSFKNAFELSKETNDFNNQIEASYCLAKCLENVNQNSEAEKWYVTTVDLIEKLSFPLTLNQEIHIAHYSGFNEIYNSLTDYYLKHGNEEQAFILLEKSRARNTRQNINKLKLVSDLKDYDELNKLIDLQWMINSGLYSQRENDSLSIIYANLKSELMKKNGEINTVLGQSQPLNFPELQKELSDDECFVQIYSGENFITLFKLSSAGLTSETLNITRDSLLNMIGGISPIYKSSLESEEIYVNEDLFSFNAQAAYDFYNIIFRNFLSSVPKNSTLILSLPAELIKLPVEMLVTMWEKDASPYFYGDKKFLLTDYQFVYSPSISIYFTQKNKKQISGDQNLLVGNPFVDNSELTLSVRTGLIELNPSKPRSIKLFPLKFSEEEITSIDETIDNNIVLLSSNATESNFKEDAPKSKIIHISSHSFLIKDQPLVMFSPQKDEVEDGFLELGEIVQLGLNSELVVLSSCRSGLGRVDAAEGIIGMQKAFFEAGSKSVVVSLWDVNDKYTSYFMKEFYKQLASGKSKSEALKEAKIYFIKNYSANPYYWSAFILSGNPSAITLQEASSFKFIYIFGLLFIIGLIYLIVKRLVVINR